MEVVDKVSVAYKLVEECQLRQFVEVIECGLDANRIIQDKGISLLHLSVGIEPITLSTEFTKILLHNGADPNIRSEDFMTPLHVAAAWGRLGAVKLLISYGADITLLDYESKTALNYAYEEQHWAVIDYLLQISESNYYDEDVDKSPAFNLELDKVVLINGDIVAEYKENCHEIKSSSFELIEKSNYNHHAVSPKKYVLENKLNRFFSPHENGDFKTKDIILTKDFKNLPHEPNYNFINVSSRRKTILNNDSSDSFRKRIFNHFQRIRKSGNSDDIFFSHSSSDSKDTLENSSGNKESSDGVSFIRFSPTDENNQYSCFIIKNSDNSYGSNGSQESAKKISPSYSLTSTELDQPNVNKEIPEIPKNKLYPDLSELLKPDAPLLNKTYELYVPDFSDPEITEDNDRLNDCIIDDSKSSCSFKTAKSNVNSFVEVTLEKFNSNLKIVDETGSSIEEEYRYTDEDEGVVLIERRLLVTPVLYSSNNSLCSERTALSGNRSVASSVPQIMNYDNQTLRKELTGYGIDVGPITDTTKTLYLKKLYKLKKNSAKPADKVAVVKRKCYSIELEKTFRHPNWCTDLTFYSDLEFKVSLQFAQPDGRRKWREGNVKSSFTYLLLDPRVTDNLPCRAVSLNKADLWRTFIDSIFYIGKGKRSRPYNHLYQAVAFWNKDLKSKSDMKINHILDIWSEGLGVVCLHVFQNVIPVEAYTREAAMIDVLGLTNLKNTQSGSYYGVAASWPMKERRKLGLYLLYRSMLILLNEGERQLKPGDIGK